jgi:hypothetical protein
MQTLGPSGPLSFKKKVAISIGGRYYLVYKRMSSIFLTFDICRHNLGHIHFTGVLVDAFEIKVNE